MVLVFSIRSCDRSTITEVLDTQVLYLRAVAPKSSTDCSIAPFVISLSIFMLGFNHAGQSQPRKGELKSFLLHMLKNTHLRPLFYSEPFGEKAERGGRIASWLWQATQSLGRTPHKI